MQINIKCPSCKTDGGFFIDQKVFQGPYKCWKCKAFSTIKVKNGEVQLCEPLSQEELEKQKAAKEVKKKAK